MHAPHRPGSGDGSHVPRRQSGSQAGEVSSIFVPGFQRGLLPAVVGGGSHSAHARWPERAPWPLLISRAWEVWLCQGLVTARWSGVQALGRWPHGPSCQLPLSPFPNHQSGPCHCAEGFLGSGEAYPLDLRAGTVRSPLSLVRGWGSGPPRCLLLVGSGAAVPLTPCPRVCPARWDLV